ncbi:MAG: hypothetical protein NTW11_03095 [Candidatus Staskawiczbacteria bacterium]|nr:hypothetical protein [Candidatus Staskawiczbacteria bacterium]
MTAKDYIEKRLVGIKEEKLTQNKELVDFIYDRIMSKKFRKYSVNPEANKKIRSSIELNIKNGEPIKIAIIFGTYKLWRFSESPEPDWAELFAMIYYACWLKPITDAYKPGVWFDFCGDDIILEFMDNIPVDNTEIYKKVFRDLIKFIQPYLPDNLKYTFSPVGDRYGSKEEFIEDLNKQIEELNKKGETALTDRDIEMMKLNIKPHNGEQIDFQKNHVLHDAYMSLVKRRSYHRRPDKITISVTPFGDRTSIPMGTTKTSVVKFQTGVGVLKKEADSYIEYIYSPSQLEKVEFSWEEIKIEGLSGKNFSKIRVI